MHDAHVARRAEAKATLAESREARERVRVHVLGHECPARVTGRSVSSLVDKRLAHVENDSDHSHAAILSRSAAVARLPSRT